MFGQTPKERDQSELIQNQENFIKKQNEKIHRLNFEVNKRKKYKDKERELNEQESKLNHREKQLNTRGAELDQDELDFEDRFNTAERLSKQEARDIIDENISKIKKKSKVSDDEKKARLDAIKKKHKK
jgi:hypothetical protein